MRGGPGAGRSALGARRCGRGGWAAAGIAARAACAGWLGWMAVGAAVLAWAPAADAQPASGRHGASLAPCAPPCRLSLDGIWRFLPGNLASTGQYAENLDDSAWQPIRVPSNWYLQGHDLAGVAWYRHRFAAPASLAGKTVRLVFQGVDYTADVWLNGVHLGFHEGYFQPFGFDVSRLLRLGRDNVLAVRVDSPNEEPGRVWSLHKRLIKGVLNHHDTRPGGAWSPRGQDGNTGGIWSSVELQVSDGAVLSDIRITPRIGPAAPAGPDGRAAPTTVADSGGPAQASEQAVRAEIDLRLSMADGQAAFASGRRTRPPAGAVELELVLAPHNFAGPAVRRVLRVDPAAGVPLRLALDAPAARLWWPAGHGAPNLYRLTVSARRGGRLLDRAERVFGFRSVAFDAPSGTWTVNGRRLFLRGTNYIPTQWLSQMGAADYARDLQLMRAAHINAIRVHAHVGAEAFYRACDEAGLLVWQDFALQWGYQDTAALHREAARQAADMVGLLYNHPSIIAWSLHNEPPWDADWMRERYPDYDPRQNRLLDETLHGAVQAIDATRHVHRFSGTDEHPWQGWYGGHWADFARPTAQPLITEFGAQALPNLASLRRFLSEDELWPDTEADWAKWAYHNFQKRETFEIARIEMGDTIERFIANSQAYQARLLTLASEALRRQKYRPVGSLFQFMFVESWPSMNWGVVDHWRQPKAGYAALQMAYQPLLPSIEWDRDRFAPGEPVRLALWAVNDTWDRLPGARYAYTLRALGGEAPIEAGEQALDIEPDSARKVMQLPELRLSAGDYELVAVIRSAAGAELARNRFAFRVAQPAGSQDGSSGAPGAPGATGAPGPLGDPDAPGR